MTEDQKRLTELLDKREVVLDKLEIMNDHITVLMEKIGVGEMWQAADKTVYQIHVPKGRYVSFQSIDCKRTNRLGENRGGVALSKKDAIDAGFTL